MQQASLRGLAALCMYVVSCGEESYDADEDILLRVREGRREGEKDKSSAAVKIVALAARGSRCSFGLAEMAYLLLPSAHDELLLLLGVLPLLEYGGFLLGLILGFQPGSLGFI